MTPIEDWLRQVGLDRYADAFVSNGIGMDVLQDLTEADLESMGVLLGDRKRILRARARKAPSGPFSPAPGQQLSSEHLPSEQQPWRRQLTVLFCDLVASTALAARVDPEDLRGVIRSFQDTCAGVIVRAGGYVARFMGDGLLAYFGYPQVYEDSAERAVRCGLDLLAHVGALRQPGGEKLRVRVGVATGIVVGESIGEDAAREAAVVGQAPNIAARLQSLSPEDSVYISESTYRLLGQMFVCEDRGLHTLKGFPEKARVWQVLGERAAITRFEARHVGRLTTLIGREHELRRLRDLWAESKTGAGRVALLRGEPGIGKSRMCQALLEVAAKEPHFPVQLQCSPQHTSSAFHPVIQFVERAARFRPEDSAETKLSKLQSLVAVGGTDRLADMPLFAALMSLPTGGRFPALELASHQLKDLSISALIRQWCALSRIRPIIFLIEDAHWIDPSTLELMKRLVDRIPNMPIMMVVTFRPEFYPLFLDRAHVSLLHLNRMGREEANAIIADLTGGKPLPSETLDHIISKTDGVPMFIEELTKSVLESGMLLDEGDHYAVNGTVQSLSIPATLHDSLLARLDRLSESREIAQVGAAIGREFSYRLLAAVAPVGRQDLASSLVQLTAAELIFSHGVPPDSLYVFKHALVQDAAYESLLRSHRQMLHGRIADVISEQFPDIAETEPELVAHHLVLASRAPEAISFLLKAGERAIERSAVVEAINLLKRALQLQSSVPTAGEDRRLALAIQVRLAQAMLAAHGYAAPETQAVLLRARALIGDETAPDDQMRILYMLWAWYYVGSDVARQGESAAELMTGAIRHGEPVSLCIANRALGTTHFAMGDFAAARRYLDQARELCDPSRASNFGFGQDVEATVLCYLALVLWQLGKQEQARAIADAALARARALSHPHTLAYTLAHASGVLAICRRDPWNVLSEAATIATVCEEYGFAFWGAGARILRGWALAKGGSLDQGLAEMGKGLTEWVQSGAQLWRSFFLAAKAEVLLECGRVQDAACDVDLALETAEKTGERWAVPEVLRVKAAIALRSPDLRASDEAEALLRRGIQIAHAQGAASWRLRSASDLERLLRSRGRAEEGVRLLKNAFAEFKHECGEAEVKAAATRIAESASALLASPQSEVNAPGGQNGQDRLGSGRRSTELHPDGGRAARAG